MADELPAHMRPERSFQGLILQLQRFWADRGVDGYRVDVATPRMPAGG